MEIAQQATPLPISTIAERLGISAEQIEPYGRFKAKIPLNVLEARPYRREGRLVLVTAVSPTPAGEGKTTTTVGLGDALTRLGEKAMLCLREPALGPVFGMKGGAAGGGHAQVIPMEDINLHFTGDFPAIAAANNLLATMIDNHIFHGNALGIDPRRVTWRRVLDVNDRALRDIVTGLGGINNGLPREAGFDIVPASEVMAVFCLATSLADLRDRLGSIVIGHTYDKRPVLARDLKAHGAMAALLRDALAPNLVQTMEYTPAFVHGGPFANIAHGTNTVIATQAALGLADWVVTEAGFGADLGAEKYFDIVCRRSGLRPAVSVVVTTVRAMKYHGGVEVADLTAPDVAAVRRGLVNLERHVETLRDVFGQKVVVAINHRAEDAPVEVAAILEAAAAMGVRAVEARHFAEGGAGAEDLARAVMEVASDDPAEPTYAYPLDGPLWEKLRDVASKVYRAKDINASAAIRRTLRQLEDEGFGELPVCVAKTQYSFSTDPKLRGAPEGHIVDVREVRLSAGAEFVVMVCGSIMTMPGLPARPSAESIDVLPDGSIVGLF